MLKKYHRFLTLLPIVLFASPMYGSLTNIDFFKNIEYSQTSGAAPTTAIGYFASLRAFTQNAGDFTGVDVTYPGPGSPQALTLNGTAWLFQTSFLGSQATLDSEYPFGVYTFDAAGGSPESASIDYTADAYTADIPAFTAATFLGLQGMNPGNAFTLNFNAFTPHGSSTTATTFLTVFGTPFFAAYSPSTTSVVLAANTFLPNTTYTMQLDFSDRIDSSDGGIPTTMGFDVRTDITFTTGDLTSAPEPGSLSFAVLGAALLALGVRRRAA